jgi:aspartate carbamoyltransferase catalytic subunit
MNKPTRGSLLGIEHLETKEIQSLLSLARRMHPQKTRPLLRGKRIVLLFYEVPRAREPLLSSPRNLWER